MNREIDISCVQESRNERIDTGEIEITQFTLVAMALHGGIDEDKQVKVGKKKRERERAGFAFVINNELVPLIKVYYKLMEDS